jgi:hypothetical protein
MILELSFPAHGDAPLPAEHDALIYQAIKSVVPTLCGRHDVHVLPLSGRRLGDRLVLLMPWSELTLRLPDVRIGEFLALSRRQIWLGHQLLRLGTPQVRLPDDAASQVKCGGATDTVSDAVQALYWNLGKTGQ